MSNFYEIKLENDRLLCLPEFVEFCVANQNQNIALRAINEGHCLEHTGVYHILDLFHFRSVTIDTCNALESHNVYQINNQGWYHWLTSITDFDYAYDRTWNQRYVFGAIYGRPSSARLGLAGFLAKKFGPESLILTGFDFSNSDARAQFDIHRLFEWDIDAIHYTGILNNGKYRSKHYYQRGSYCQNNTLSHEYRHFLIDVIVEPVVEGKSFFPTEKLTRTILCRRPFIVMASKNYLDYLHQMGFHSFNEFWSEDYDGYDSAERYRRILSLLTDLGNRPLHDLMNLYEAMTFQLDHNFDLVTNRQFLTDIRYIP